MFTTEFQEFKILVFKKWCCTDKIDHTQYESLVNFVEVTSIFCYSNIRIENVNYYLLEFDDHYEDIIPII